MRVYWLQVTEPGYPPRVVPVRARLVVGRDTDGLLLRDPTVSRRHLYLEPVNDELLCVDLGSANGTFIEGARLVEPRPVRAGTRITLGQTELLVHAGRETPGGSVPAAPVDPHERPSEAVRDLTRASAKTYRAGRRL